MRPVNNSLAPREMFLALLTSLALLGCAGCKSDDSKGAYSAADVVWISTYYPAWMDALVPGTSVKVQRSGDATCSRRDWTGAQWSGQLPAADSTIPDLLSRPGLVRDLATPCPVVRKDSGPYISTRFANDGDDVVHDRLVDSGCTNANLDALMQALEKIGDACIASPNTQVVLPDGGFRAEVGSDVALELGPLDVGIADVPVDVDVMADVPLDAGCLRPLSEFASYCPQSYDDVRANRVTCQTYEAIDIGQCASDHWLMIRRDFGTHVAECFYDPASHALAAATFSNDVPICGGSRIESTRATPFCQPVCGDGCDGTTDARFVGLSRYKDCCRSWAFPIPGCPADGGAGQ
jgi:hypothetical protein